MSYKWVPSAKFKGVRYHQHESRKHGVQFDKLFSLRYQLGGKRYENNLGWASEGWTEAKAGIELAKLKEAYKLGEGAISLNEKRKIAQEQRDEEERIQREKEKQLITFAQFWQSRYWPAQQHKAKGSLNTEKGLYANWLEPALAKKPLVHIETAELEGIKQEMLQAGRAPSSIKYVFAVFSQVWSLAKLEKVVQGDSPTKGISLPKRDNRRERFLTQEEAQILLTHLKRQSIQVHDMSLLALHCGLRFGEIAQLDWQSVDLDTGTLSIRDPKSRNNRVAFLTPPLVTILQERKLVAQTLDTLQNGLVFPSRKGGLMTSISHAFNRTVDKLFNEGVSDPRQRVCFHTLRHTFASWLVQRGVNLYSVKELMGHSDFKMTQRYSHLSPDGLRKAAMVIHE